MSEKVYCSKCKFYREPGMSAWCVNPGFGSSSWHSEIDPDIHHNPSVHNKNNDCSFFELKWHRKLWKKLFGAKNG